VASYDEEVTESFFSSNRDMETPLTAIEMTGAIDEHQQLHLDGLLPIGPQRVRVILLYPSESAEEESEWLSAASRNPAFHDLSDPAEDVYSLNDGKEFNDSP
jgi:hypothetical protein